MNPFDRNALLIRLFDDPKKDLWSNFEMVLHDGVTNHSSSSVGPAESSMWTIRHPSTMPGLLIKVPLENASREFSMALVLDLMYGGPR